jgi:hypothetical protein
VSEVENPIENPKRGVGPNPNLVPGNPGNSGGKKGRSGRLPEEYRMHCRELVDSPKARAAVKRILADDTHQHFASLYRYLGDRGYGKAEQPLTAPEGGVTIRVVRE